MHPVQFKQARYDFVFLGTGLASLSLLMRMLDSDKLRHKKMLLIDREPKTSNDRTWCFWEKGEGYFENIVHHRWPHISFLSEEYSSDLAIDPYEYKMIRAIDLYSYCLDRVSQYENVELVYAGVEDWDWKENKELRLQLNGTSHSLEADLVFNSIYTSTETAGTIGLLQHFKGWLIETEQPCFDKDRAIMMDFRVHQSHGTSFAYVLPVSTNRALVEYTLFTKALLAPETYEAELRDYISTKLGIDKYRIVQDEFGIIPMTTQRFRFRDKAYNLGTAGGQTKGSSGYTFQFIQKNSDMIIKKLLADQPLDTLKNTASRFRFYDNVLLHILYHDTLPGKKIFSTLFRKNEAQQVLKFLDNETSLAEELKIISTLPTLPFLKAALKIISN